MNTEEITVLVICETVAAFGLAHLWSRKHRVRVLPRLLWSEVILIPALGIIIYGLARPHPEEHGDELPQCEDPPEK